jgi:hypothetical protein
MPPHFYQPAEGDLLHHYTSCVAGLSIARSGKVWLSDFARMNDQSEYHYAKEGYLAAYQSRRVWIGEIPRYIATSSLIGLEQNTNMFIGCFCAEPDNPHLLQHYASDGSGCVLSFDASHIRDHAGVCMRRVVYDPADLERFVQSGLSMLQTQFDQAPDDYGCLTELANFFASDLFAFKAPQWSAEREIRLSRLIVRKPAATNGLVDAGGHAADLSRVEACDMKVRSGAYGSAAYIELPFDSPGMGALREITLGHRCTPIQVAEFEQLPSVREGYVKLILS